MRHPTTPHVMSAHEALRVANKALAEATARITTLETQLNNLHIAALEVMRCRKDGSFGSDGYQGWNLLEEALAAIAKARGEE